MREEGPESSATPESTDTADSLLREVAHASARPPPSREPDPIRVAHFRIERRLGKGGMGVVFRAFDEKLKRSVALKVLPTAFESDPDRRRRFVREARSAAAITHPNIAAIYDAGEADGHVFIAMELVEGQTLRQRLLDDLSLGECLRLGKEIARGLARAHEKGIVHRDLKPENVMLTQHDEVKILDFGLAKLLERDAAQRSTLLDGETEDNLTQDGGVVGTPAYMAPEQALGAPVDARADVFSLGVVLFEMLTGARPFQGATSFAVMLSVGRDTPRPPSEQNPDVPAELDRVLLRCLAKERGERYANGGELLRALESIQAGATASLSGSTTANAPEGRASPASRRGGSSARRGRVGVRMLGIGLAVVAVVAVVAVAALSVTWRQSRLSSAPSPAASTRAVASDVPSVPTAIGLLDHPPPATKNAEAATEYRRALTDLRDGVRVPQSSLERAVELDPDFAAAHLRYSIAILPPSSTHEYGEALRTRESLDERDQAILNAEAPIGAGVPPDLVEGERRYAALHEARPTDVEILMRLAAVRGRRDPKAARATFAALLALVPTMAGAELAAGNNELDADDLEAARGHYERCTSLSPMGARCISHVARLEAVNGHCDAYARDVTHVLRLEPEDQLFRRDGLAAALSTGAGQDQALASVLLVAPAAQAPRLEAWLVGQAALWHGAMGEAREHFVRAEVLARDGTAAAALPWTTDERLTIAEESGDADEIRAVVREYVGARALATPEDEVDFDGVVLRAMRDHRLAPEAEILQTRDRWRKDASGEPAPLVWLNYEAGIASTPGEAANALASGYATQISHDRLDVNAKLGSTLLLAERFPEAAARLRLVAYNCALFRDEDSYVRLIAPAARDLGLALEGAGDVPGACDAYARVKSLWGDGAPRSMTVQKARARFEALHCAAHIP